MRLEQDHHDFGLRTGPEYLIGHHWPFSCTRLSLQNWHAAHCSCDSSSSVAEWTVQENRKHQSYKSYKHAKFMFSKEETMMNAGFFKVWQKRIEWSWKPHPPSLSTVTAVDKLFLKVIEMPSAFPLFLCIMYSSSCAGICSHHLLSSMVWFI